jgi:hypothetical protein
MIGSLSSTGALSVCVTKRSSNLHSVGRPIISAIGEHCGLVAVQQGA